MAEDLPDLALWPHLFEPGRESGSGPGRVILALHGTGSNEIQAAQLARQVLPGATILAPRGRVNEGGASRWFRREAEGVFDVDDVIFRAAELASFVRWATAEYSLDRGGEVTGGSGAGGSGAGGSGAGGPIASGLIAVGFSNGANMALGLALRHPEIVRIVVAFSGMYPFGERPLPGPLNGTRLLLLNGQHDPMAPQRSVATLTERTTEAGAAVTAQLRPGGHGISDDELDYAREWVTGLT